MKKKILILVSILVVFLAIPPFVNYWVSTPSPIGFIPVEKQEVWISFYGVKGEEYHTVIAFGLLYGKVPSIYTSYDKMNEEANKLLYVIASRAKKRIYLFSEKGRRYWDNGVRQYVDAFPTKQLFQNNRVEYDV